MSNESAPGGTEWELAQAEAALAAGDPALALAMRRHADAIRNMMQGVLVPMFVELVERSMVAQLAPLIDGQKETHSGLAALSAQFLTLTITVGTHAARLDHKRAELDDIQRRLAALEAAADHGT